jgi:hypothetical protein
MLQLQPGSAAINAMSASVHVLCPVQNVRQPYKITIQDIANMPTIDTEQQALA